jgi:hypothetical protein
MEFRTVSLKKLASRCAIAFTVYMLVSLLTGERLQTGVGKGIVIAIVYAAVSSFADFVKSKAKNTSAGGWSDR